MKLSKMLSGVIVLMILTGLSFAADEGDWSHHDEYSWPGKCTTGEYQSPIDIQPRTTIPDPLGIHIRGKLVYRGYGNVRLQARNTGYNVQWLLAPGEPAPVLSGGPLRANYTFAEVHFHWLAEHSFDGIKSPLEIHFVHLKNGLTLPEATQERDGVAVIGVMAEVSSTENSGTLSDFLPAMDQILTQSSQPTSETFDVDLTRIFSPNPQAYYTYHGSLTTPGCPEVVTWMVMQKPIYLSHFEYKNLTRADLSGINNDRTVQPLGMRLVYRSNAVSKGIINLASPTLLGTLMALVGCFGTKVSSGLFNGVSNLFNGKKKLVGICD